MKIKRQKASDQWSVGQWSVTTGLLVYWLLIIGHWPFVFFSVACQPTAHQSARTYTVNGQVIRVAPDRTSVVIQHEDIKGFMPAMTMSFAVKDPKLVDGLTPGDLVRFELVVTDQESWIARIEKTGRAPGDARGQKLGATPNLKSQDEGHPSVDQQWLTESLTPGQAFPQFTLTDQNGRRVRLEDLRGKAVAITFIYTRCPLPEYCPRFTSHFAAVQDQLSPKFPDQFHLLSISIDPAFDRPQVLRDYGRRYGADFRTWSFLTGPEEEVRKVANACSVRYWPEAGIVTHTSACAVLSPWGTLYKLYRGNTWTPEEVVSDLTTLLQEQRTKQGEIGKKGERGNGRHPPAGARPNPKS